MDWEDRERVLRLLFSKMNAGVPANVQPMHSEGREVRGDPHSQIAIEGEYMPAIEYE